MNPVKRCPVWMLGLTLVLGAAAPAWAQKTVLRMRLDGPVLEATSDAGGLMALLQQERPQTLREWVKTIRLSASDANIAGLVLIIEQPEMKLAQVEELTAALRAFRKAGKPVYCYLDEAGNATYALAAAADHITLAENSLLNITGLRIELSFYKGLLDKIGVEADLMHCGAYKSALEPFTRTEPSPEAAENVNWLLDGLYNRWIELIAEGRRLKPDEVRALVDRAPLNAADARKAKLVDEVSSFPAFRQLIQKQFGKDVKVLKEYKKKSGLEIDFQNPFAIFQALGELFQAPAEATTPAVGLITIAGPIMVGENDNSPLGGESAGSTTLRAALEQAREDDHIKAVVVRVDSPGGSALASDIIWEAATRCAAEKLLIVSMGGVAGSGGYYVAIPGDTILADAATITGSIGVVGGKFVWSGLMEDKLGITTTEFVRGKHAGLMTLNRKWDDAERKFMMDYMTSVYDQFKGRVMASRGQRLKKNLEDIAGGRVYTGAQALELGLVDQLGGLWDALDLAAKKAGLPADYEVRVLPRPSELVALLDMLGKLSGKDDRDAFEIAVADRLRSDSLLRAALTIGRDLSPAAFAELRRALQNLLMLQRERVGCFMPAVPQIR